MPGCRRFRRNDYLRIKIATDGIIIGNKGTGEVSRRGRNKREKIANSSSDQISGHDRAHNAADLFYHGVSLGAGSRGPIVVGSSSEKVSNYAACNVLGIAQRGPRCPAYD